MRSRDTRWHARKAPAHIPGLPFWDMPETLSVGGVCFSIHTDFRAGIRVRELWNDDWFRTRQETLLTMTCRILFCDTVRAAAIPQEEMIPVVLWYLLDGRVEMARLRARLSAADTCNPNAEPPNTEKMFSFKWDMPAVYAAFRSVYQIDLLCIQHLHLWAFDALLAGLPQDSILGRTVAQRRLSLSDIQDDEARARAAAEKLWCRVPDDETLMRMCIDKHRIAGDR